VLTAAGFALTGTYQQMPSVQVWTLFALLASSLFVIGVWLEHRPLRFAVDGIRGGLLASAGLWMPLVINESVAVQEAWVETMQILGVVNVLAVSGLYLLQRGPARAAAI
jgi:hypothetical protein